MKPRKSKEEEFKNKTSQPTHFYKLMVSPSQQSKLRIPKKFARTRRNELSNPVILKVPTGETRKVVLVEEENELCFRDGWEDFVNSFSIGIAYFMLFEYEGNSNFKVNIFDLTGLEISYQCNAHTTNSYVQQEGIDYDDDSKKPEILLHSSSFNSKARSSEDDEVIMDDAKEGSWYPLCFNRYKGIINVVKNAGYSLPRNPFFVAPIKDYVLRSGQYLNIPMPFGQRYLRCEIGERRFVTFEAYDGREWEVGCVRDKTKHTFRPNWMTFAREIGLEVGDICVFEVKNAENYVLRVRVVKNSEIRRVSEDTF